MNENEIEHRLLQNLRHRVNTLLKAGKIGVTILLKGNRLYLRGTFPARPGSSKSFPHQQEIALGIEATLEGIRSAEKEARKVGGLLACQEFSWEPYLRQRKGTQQSPKTIGDWISALETDYFTRRAKTPQSQTTWNTNYKEVFTQLPQKAPLNVEVLQNAIASTKPDTRMRQKTCLALDKLAQFAGVEFDVKRYVGNYSPKKVTPRELPTDKIIASSFHLIQNPSWQWGFGMLATYGLRPHELFHLDVENFRKERGILTVLEGKTGSRRIWPLHPEWVEQFSLLEVKVPQCTAHSNRDFGQRVTQYFRRQNIPFRPYDLRHCWAIRSLEYGLEISLAAQQMGHSAVIHSQTYHAWLVDQHHQQAFERLLSRPNRPLPPQID